ncbi:MAG: ABC transporter ATP-binding protein [Chitinophagaceae bacterium]|jgi:lipoprotein-releasing system ATP-binding protein|nr:ABC transporter ATP-binding protein [Chitinophagaceae bacterium]
MDQSPNLLVAKDIWKQYGPVSVLKGVSLELKRGELVSIVGPSGAGKSTLLYIVSSLEKADKGQVFFEGQDITQLSETALAHYRNQKIGFVFQFHHLLPEFTAIENVSIPGWIAKMPSKQIQQKAMELLDFMGLSDKMDKKPHSLSGGEQQRVAVARALLNSPAIIFADEPTGNLDSENANALHQLFIRLRNEMNQSFLIVTHNESLASLSNRSLTMKDGKFL